MTQAQSPASTRRRLRAAALGTAGGASSLLRLSRPGSAALPTGAAMSQWVARAAASLHAPR
jgi:hypothetical protein